jgi:hypothetical protein
VSQWAYIWLDFQSRETTLFKARLRHIEGHDLAQFGSIHLVSILPGPHPSHGHALIGACCFNLSFHFISALVCGYILFVSVKMASYDRLNRLLMLINSDRSSSLTRNTKLPWQVHTMYRWTNGLCTSHGMDKNIAPPSYDVVDSEDVHQLLQCEITE